MCLQAKFAVSSSLVYNREQQLSRMDRRLIKQDGQMVKRLFRNITGMKCLSCGLAIGQPELHLVCGSCLDELVPLDRLSEKTCAVCSTNIYKSSKDVCSKCALNRPLFIRNSSLFYYTSGIVRELIHRFKFEYNQSAGKDLAMLIRSPLERCLALHNTPMIVSVPLSEKSIKKRGFNQVDFLLNRCGVKVSPLLRRKEHSVKQSELGLDARKILIHGQFEVIPVYGETLRGKRVLLVDDIYTTGSTASEIAEVLLNGGAESVEVLTFFRD